mgnify:CR=1 FL=1
MFFNYDNIIFNRTYEKRDCNDSNHFNATITKAVKMVNFLIFRIILLTMLYFFI